MAQSTKPARSPHKANLAHLGKIEVEYTPIDALTPYKNNARTHTRHQIRQIADSIKEFGFTNPVLIDESGSIIAGHARIEAAKLLNLDPVPTIRFANMTEAQKRAYVIADNRLAELAGWDIELLTGELRGLIELDFDLEVIGFEPAELDQMLQIAPSDGDEADLLPETPLGAPVITRPADVWLLDHHRLLCGNAAETTSYQLLMASKNAHMAFSDPPFNVPVDGHVSGLGATRHREFAMASGEMTKKEFTAFLTTVLDHMAANSKDGSLHYVCMDWRHLQELLQAGEAAYHEFKNLCVWVKSNGGMGSLYRSRHELVAVFKYGKRPHRNNVALGRHGRNRTNVWEYAGVNTFREGRMEDLAAHPTVKSVQMVADAILDCTRRKDIVLDPFCGSGTTIMAAERTGRHCYAMEIDPAYCDTAIRRWQAFTGGDAVLEATGETFTRLSETRSATQEQSANRKETPDVQIRT